jgi:GT2 family glycosyltransferase
VDLSFVIVNWNSRAYLSRLLDSIAPLKREVAKIVVVDNGSTDSSEMAVIEDELTELLPFSCNKGFARAANAGISRTKTPFVLLANPDILICPDTVTNLYREMELRPQAAIVCGALVSEEGEPQEVFQIRSLPTFKSVLIEVLFGYERARFLEPRRYQSSMNLKGTAPHEVEQPAAAFWLLRKEAWSSIGGFDERFFPAWFEDVDFCKRLVAEGWQILYFPQWRISHRGGVSLKSLDYREFLAIYYGNLLRYWEKHHRASLPLIWLPVRLGWMVRRFWIRR